MTAPFWLHLKPRQEAVETALRAALGRFTADAPPRLTEAMAYSLCAPGKRLRPLLCILASEAVGGSVEAALPAGCALEMVHTYSLIHDDLPAMDDDDLRRGRPTCHVRYDEATAILAGDALLTLAFEAVAEGYPPRTAAVSCVELAKGAGAVGMVGGQMLDLEAEKTPVRNASAIHCSDLENIHRRKTGALFRTALRLGVHAVQGERAVGSDPVTIGIMDEYSAALGLLFQVTDDLLDAEGDTTAAGKRVGKDAARGKLTYPGLLGVEASRRKASDLGQDAIAAAERLGPGGKPLAELARYVVARDR